MPIFANRIPDNFASSSSPSMVNVNGTAANGVTIDENPKNPKVVGCDEWSMVKQPIHKLFGPYFSTYYVLNFYVGFLALVGFG